MLDLSDPMGKAKISDDDGHTIVLKRPKWNQLETLRFAQQALIREQAELQKEAQALQVELREQVAAATDAAAENGDAPAAIDESVFEEKINQFQTRIAEATAGWYRKCFETLGENYPDCWPQTDWKEWPAWMLEGTHEVHDAAGTLLGRQGAMADLMAYWRTVPLDRGQMGRPIAN